MKKYILIDSYNLFFRALYTCKSPDIEMDKGAMIHSMFMMIKKACNLFHPDHIIVCRDGFSSWRYNLYPKYKANRMLKINDMTPAEAMRFEKLKSVFEKSFLPFLENQTNVSVLGFPEAEADDLICGFIRTHKDDSNIIVSTDNDFVQLVSDNVVIYNSMDDRIITNKGVVDVSSKKPKMLLFKIKDGKVSIPKEQPKKMSDKDIVPMKDWVKYALFTKCIRGDKSDNIMSAYPGIREKSSKTNIGLLEAFEGMGDKNYNWVSFMNQIWVDDFGNKHKVCDEYEKNRQLIDLSCIPAKLKMDIDDYISNHLNRTYKNGVLMTLSKYFKQWNLPRLLQDVNYIVGYFSKTYEGK